jgi:acetyl esterase
MLARPLLGRVAADVGLSDLTVAVGDVVLRARVYRRRDAEIAEPLVINFHGGGFVYGNLTAADWLCGNVAGRAGVTVVSVEYRLAPEHPAPIPYEDCWAATRWLVEHAAELGVDRTRVSLMGESAGGNLAALVALTGRDRVRNDPDWPRFVRQILIYPATDLTLSSASVSELVDAPLLARRTLDWYGRRYLPQGTPTSISYDDPRVSPLYATDHGELAPALVLAAGQDPLRDDALRYADALTAAGTPVRTVVYPEAIHGFMSIPHFEPAAHQGLAEIVAELTGG